MKFWDREGNVLIEFEGGTADHNQKIIELDKNEKLVGFVCCYGDYVIYGLSLKIARKK